MTQYKVGISDLKAHLSSYLKKAQEGHTIIVTSHGKPIAQLNSASEELMDRVKALQKAGLILWNGKKLIPRKPVLINKSDKLISDLVSEMNNEYLY